MIGKLFERIRRRGNRHRGGLVVLDDIFPNPLSPFRIAEYNGFLERFDDSAVLTSGSGARGLEGSDGFGEILEDYARRHPRLAGRVRRLESRDAVFARLGYVMFLNNADRFLDLLERNRIPFVLELYPGGGFQLGDAVSDGKLRRVTSSPRFRKAIVTQRVTRDYLLSNGFCAPEDVTFIYGGVFPAGRLASDQPARRRFPRDKETLDICFVAYKYMERGRDKGYDVFVETARNLARRAPEARFHVVGSFGPGDVDASDIRDRMTFHGPRTTGFFPEFYSGMDLVLSPNAPHILSPGAFDGFPTGACIEAGLCGTAVFACDELGLNPFVDGEEIVVVPRDPARIADTVMAYRDDPARLERVGRGGQERFREAFSEENQMEPRIRVVEELLASGRGEAG